MMIEMILQCKVYILDPVHADVYEYIPIFQPLNVKSTAEAMNEEVWAGWL